MITPKQDWMIVRKIEEKTAIIMPENASSVAEMIPFEILSIGPGLYKHGVFVKTTHNPGDRVFINGPVTETKFNKVSYFFSREEYAVAQLT